MLLTLYILHIAHIDVFYPFHEKFTFGKLAARNVSSPTVFDLDG